MSGHWLEDFVRSLGHEVMDSRPRGQGIHEVRSRTPSRGKGKRRISHLCWALDRGLLEKMRSEEYEDLLHGVFNSKASRKVVFLTNSIGGPSERRNLLTHTLARSRTQTKTTSVVDLDHPGPGIVVPGTTPLPPPVPFLRPPEIEPWNEIEDPIISHIPWAGRGPRGCPWVILVEPEVDCAEAAKRGFSWKLPPEKAPKEHPRWGPFMKDAAEKEDAWREGVLALSQVLVRPQMYPPEQMIYPTEPEVKLEIKRRYGLVKGKLRVSSKGVLESMGECYCRILKEAVDWANHCMQATGGRRGGVIVVRISPHAVPLGLQDRPCHEEFEKAFDRMNKHWEKKGHGMTLWQQYW